MAHQPVQHPPVGSHDDICAKIRQFYAFWDDTVGQVPTKIALRPEDIDIEAQTLTSDEAQLYRATHSYVASGFVMRGLYPGTGDEVSKTLVEKVWLVESHSVPKVVARCERVKNRRSWVELEAGNLVWINAEKAQAIPVWRRLIEGHPESCFDFELAKWFAFPRAAAIQPSFPGYTKENPREVQMDNWLEICATNNKPFSFPGSEGYEYHWYQLPGRPELTGSHEERKKGSPSTPYFTPFLLSIFDLEERRYVHSVIVTFQITQDSQADHHKNPKDAAVSRDRRLSSASIRIRLPPMIAQLAPDHQAHTDFLEPSTRESIEGPSVG
ncbi:hypothetical protein JCM5353_004993 [Sporobolomyces roseus]